jgi:hypothetical protein
MPVLVNLSPDVERDLTALAAERGLSLADYLQEIALREASRASSRAASTANERAEAFLEWADSVPDTPPLSDEAISRASMYPDRW